MCVFIATAAGSVKIIVCDLRNTTVLKSMVYNKYFLSYDPECCMIMFIKIWTSLLCQYGVNRFSCAGSTSLCKTCTIRIRQHASVVYMCCHYTCVLQDCALWWACVYSDVVRAQELLSLGTNINYHHDEQV